MAKRRTTLPQKRGDKIKLVVKSNDLVEAKYMFSIWETRFFHTLVAMIDKNDNDDKVHRVYFKDIRKNFNLGDSHRSYDLLREAAKSLARKPVYIGWMNDNVRRGREYFLFEMIDYAESGQSGQNYENQSYVDVKIHKTILPFLLYVKKKFDPKITRYTSYDLRNIEKLKPYAVRMYELMKQHEYKGFREITVLDLKEMFLITNEYPRFSTFNQSVIKPSIKAINKHTDLFVDPKKIEKIKKGRKVHALRFPIKSKTPQEIQEIRKEPESEPVQQLLLPLFEEAKKSAGLKEGEKVEVVNVIKTTPQSSESDEQEALFKEFETDVVVLFGVSRFRLVEIIKVYEAEVIRKQVRLVKRRMQKGKVANPAGLFMEAVKNNYNDPEEAKEKRKQERKRKLEQSKLLKVELEAIENEMNEAINDRIREITSKDEAIVELAMAKLMENTFVEKRMKRMGITEPTVDDFRKDKVLVGFMKNEIINQNRTQFEDILVVYQGSKDEIQNKMKDLKV